MQILGLLGMYFDAVVVEVEKYLLFFQISFGHTVLFIDLLIMYFMFWYVQPGGGGTFKSNHSQYNEVV